MNYAGREIMILASAVGSGSPLQSMFSRGRKTYTSREDPSDYGLQVGCYVDRSDGLMLSGRIASITDNDDPDDWFNFSGATEWYIEIERPWSQTEMATSLGQCKVEWLEDQLFPRVGTIISTPDDSYFRLGDVVRVA